MKINVCDAAGYIEALEPFRTRPQHEGGLWATDQLDGMAYTGDLPVELISRFTQLYLDDELVYVVYSYRTPIAWVTRNGERFVPRVFHSKTTSAHQGKVNWAWDGHTKIIN